MNRHDIRPLFVAVIAPFAILVAAVALQLAWLADVPAEVALHWGPSGEADGFGPAWAAPAILAAAALGVILLSAALLTASTRPHLAARAGAAIGTRVVAVASLFVVTLLAVLTTVSFFQQRGLTDAAAAPGVGGVLLASLAIAAVLAVGGWLLLPTPAPRSSDPAALSTSPLPLRAGERVVWIGRARYSTRTVLLLGATLILVAGVAVFAIALAGAWFVAIAPVLVAAGLATTADWRVRVDERGLTVRGMLGWPVFRVPAGQVASAAAIDLVPLAEFGGYGIRWGTGRRVGIVLRAGEALEVRCHDGRGLVVTVDDAATAAALLTAVARA